MEKKPFLTESMAQDIIQDVPTPFHVYDEKGIRENARRINKAFSWNKGFREYFAVKALPNPVILQILKEEGCGVDCSSLTELMLSEVCGFSGSDIMFSSNQTPVEDMKKAYELGAYINLDDATMVDFLDRVAGVPENIFCRYNPGGTFQLGESKEGFQVMDKPGDAKYGMTEEQMIDSYKKLAAKGAKNFGIHAFLASNTISDAYYPELAGILFQLAVRVQKATGVHIAYINLSGGVGIPYRPEQTENDIMAIGEGVRKKFEEILVPAGMGDVIGDLNARRGQIQGMEAMAGTQRVNAFVPLAQMFGYATDLRSKTQGRGQYVMEPSHYEPVPKNIADQIIAGRTKG